MICVKLMNGVYNAYSNPLTGTFYSFDSVDWQAPPGSTPLSFASEALARQRLGAIKIVGTKQPQSFRPIANAASEAEVLVQEAKGGLTQGVQPIVPHTADKKLTGTLENSLLFLFKKKRLEFSKKLKVTEKSYLNGMAHVILFLNKELKEELSNAVNIEEEKGVDLI